MNNGQSVHTNISPVALGDVHSYELAPFLAKAKKYYGVKTTSQTNLDIHH